MTSKARGKEDLPLVEVNSHANHHVRLGRNLLKQWEGDGTGCYRMVRLVKSFLKKNHVKFDVLDRFLLNTAFPKCRGLRALHVHRCGSGKPPEKGNTDPPHQTNIAAAWGGLEQP